DARLAEQQRAPARLHQILDHRDRAVDGAADAADEADRPPGAVADDGDAVQGALDAGAVVAADGADARQHILDLVMADARAAERDLAAGEARLRFAAEI